MVGHVGQVTVRQYIPEEGQYLLFGKIYPPQSAVGDRVECRVPGELVGVPLL